MPITFRKFIQEAPNNSGEYSDAIKELSKDNLRIGFEIE
jgi:hypothetical protein